MALILGLDTALGACSVAVVVDGRVRAAALEILGRGHAERLMPMIASVLKQAGIGYPDLDGVAVTNGPGTFTGVRIGVAAARGIALARGIPVVSVSTLEAVAAAVAADPPGDPPDGDLLVVHDARRGEVYLQCFRTGSGLTSGAGPSPLGPAVVVPPEEAASHVADTVSHMVGTGVDLVMAALASAGRGLTAVDAPGWPDARHVALLASDRLAVGTVDGVVRPLYLRAPDAKLPAATARPR